MDYKNLMKKAIEVCQNAYCPYSKFPVGACVLTANDKIYTGCNFENSSFGLTICAERNAIGSAIADGENKVKAIAIYSPNMEDCTPCGACRQVLYEFKSNSGLDIITLKGEDISVCKIEELLPKGFNL
ncbi:cytidine deaminase [bacterium]|nr:cytidine deaminase [bacterium]